MMGMKKKKTDRMLTEVELELMSIVWRLEECVVRDVLEALPPERDVTYTTVAKMMSILEEKGVLKSEKGERTHTFRPVLSRDHYEKRALNHVTEKLFDGNPSSMVMRLLDDSRISTDELEAIRQLLQKRLKA